jgi:hypothetical protein
MFGGGGGGAGSSSLSPVSEEKKETFDFDADTDDLTEKPTPKAAAAAAAPQRFTVVGTAEPESPAGMPKKRVSFSEGPDDVQEFEPDDVAKYADGEEPEWYQDKEVLAGLAMFAGSLGLTVLALNFALGRRR